MSAPSPLPNPFFGDGFSFSTTDQLHCQIFVILRARRAWIVQADRVSIAGAFAHAHIASNECAKNFVGKGFATFFQHLMRESISAVEHGDHDSFDKQTRIEFLMNKADGLENR